MHTTGHKRRCFVYPLGTMGRKPDRDAPLRIRPAALQFIRQFAHRYRWRMVDVVDVLIAGWKMLTPEQQHRARYPDGQKADVPEHHTEHAPPRSNGGRPGRGESHGRPLDGK